jgi:hypothetical protein
MKFDLKTNLAYKRKQNQMRIFTKKALKMSFAVAMLLGVAWSRPTATSKGRNLKQN